MIYIVTSPYSIDFLKSFCARFLSSENITYIVYNYATFKNYIVHDPVTSLDFPIDDLNVFLASNAGANDLLISFDCFHIFNNAVTKIFNRRSANFHPSPLPMYGGVNPVSWGLYNNEKCWAYTWHRIETKVDCGEIIIQNSFNITPHATQFDILRICITDGLKKIVEVIRILRGVSSLLHNPLSSKYSYFSGEHSPQISNLTLYEMKLLCKIIPFNPNPSWRWRYNSNGVHFTAVSLTKSFGSIVLKNSIKFSGQLFYYAD